MKLILNIGLARAGKPDIGPCTALRVLREAGFLVEASKLEQSDTERTLVAVVERRNLTDRFGHRVAQALEQDCIAAYNPAIKGRVAGSLLGPKAAAWGAFNPAFFIMPDGRRLSHHLAR